MEETLTIICLDSTDDEVDEVVRPSVVGRLSNVKQTTGPPSIFHSQSPNIKQAIELQKNQKRLSNDGVENAQKEVKPVKFARMSTSVSLKSKSNEEDFEHVSLTSKRAVECYDDLHENNSQNAIDGKQRTTSATNIVEKPLTESIARLIDACRKAEPSDDMETVINNKLLKYYHMVHSDFVNSESFEKLVISMTKEIQPNNAFSMLGKVLKALNIQKKIAQINCVNKSPVSSNDQREDNRVNRLYANLHKLRKEISELEATDVDLDDENHSLELHALCVRKKQRACKTYKKICKITDGLDKVTFKKPIKFKGTKYPQFNKKLQALVNQTGDCPDRVDIIRILKATNKKHKLKLDKHEVARTSEDAFMSISMKMQKRRKNDLHETISYYAIEKDPAIDDPTLEAELEKNRKYDSRIKEVINRYAAMQNTCSDRRSDDTASITSSVHSDIDDDDTSQNDKGDDNVIILE